MLIYTIYAIAHNGLHAHLFMGVLKIWKISSEKLATNDFLCIVFESVFGFCFWGFCFVVIPGSINEIGENGKCNLNPCFNNRQINRLPMKSTLIFGNFLDASSESVTFENPMYKVKRWLPWCNANTTMLHLGRI